MQNAYAQRGIAREGAIFLLLPMGTRIVTSGQSVATPEPDTDQLFWNPSGIARAEHREFAFHTGRFFVGQMIAPAAVFPLGRAGVVGAAISALDFGTQETGDVNGTTGTESQQSYVLAATYAATLGPRLSAGVTYKDAITVGSCSGLCPALSSFQGSTSAIDIGVQMGALAHNDLVVAAALRHAGLRFQVNDEAQADPLPTRIQVGVGYRLRALEGQLPGSVLHVNTDVIDLALHPGSAAIRMGADATWRGQLSLRAGYVAGSGEGTGFAAGFGFTAGRLFGDIGRTLGGGTGGDGGGSWYFTLRGRW